MKAILVAHTVINWRPFLSFGGSLYLDSPEGFMDTKSDSSDTDSDIMAEFAGRSCYQSWTRPNEKTRETVDYLKNILNQQHYSVLEHASATFYITGVSRSLTHELIRHRHLSYSELSQRYVDMSEAGHVVPPAFDSSDERILQEWVDDSRELYEGLVVELTDRGYSRKRAREAARAFLPSAMETKIVVTGNMRAWRDVISKRNSDHADAEIHRLAGELLRQLKEVAPSTFQDME